MIDFFLKKKMDNQQSTKMPKPFDNDQEFHASGGIDNTPQQFQLREDDRLKQEDDYRQGKSSISKFVFFLNYFFSSQN